MSTSIEVPRASDDPILHADCIELSALLSKSESSSFEGYVRDIRVSGTAEDLTDVNFDEDPGDRGGEQSQQVADDAWREIEHRADYCGGESGHYPFEVSATHVILRDNWQSSPYVFQLLLGLFGHTASTTPMDGARIFEKLSAEAARQYLGGEDNGAMARAFGSPRSERSSFLSALEELCIALGDGVVRTTAPRIANQKDSNLDVVAWLPFCDRRSAQLIAFGQCATGKNWADKLSELQPMDFSKEWLLEPFLVDPIKMFFVPRSIEYSKWRKLGIKGGIVFDRCRISWCVGRPDGDLAKELKAWSGYVRADHMPKK